MKKLGIGLAALAAALIVVWLLGDRRSAREEVQRLEAELARARKAPPPPPAPPPVPPPAPAPVSEPPKPPPSEPPRKPEEPAAAPRLTFPALGIPAAEVPALQAKAMDVAADPEARLDALGRLRMAQPDGRSPEVVRSMIDLLRTSPDGKIRADICRQLNRIVTDDLKQQLLITARTDAFAKAREEAAESLGPMREDPVVRSTLEALEASDADAGVRDQARKSLSGRRR